ncbi:MAG: hypothetical protein D6750_04910 [Bacteroidetes bacterium]|nr:MAG: hypothetical protein D6750_04910 [Bacteroidota bacterium]
MRYAQYIVGAALLWAVTACQSGPSKEFINQVTTELNDLKGAVDKLSALKNDISGLQDPFAALKQELGKTWTDKVEKDKELSEKIASLEKEAKGFPGEVAEVESKLNSALSEAQAFVDGLATQKKKEEDLKKEWEAIKAKVSEAVKELDEAQGGLATLKTNLQALQEAIKSKYAPKK